MAAAAALLINYCLIFTFFIAELILDCCHLAFMFAYVWYYIDHSVSWLFLP